MSRTENPLGTLEQLPKGARMWEAVYDSAQDRGYSEERSAQQAWGAVKRAGYWQDKEGKWHSPRSANPRRTNAEPGDPEYHRRNIIVDQDLAMRALEWHGGQGSMLYSFGSVAMSDYVSPSMIDAAIAELESAREWDYVKADPKLSEELNNLIGDLEARARFSSEFTTQEAGVGDVDSGYATWLMQNPAPKQISGPLRIESMRDGLWVVGQGLAIPVDSRAEAKRVKASLQRRSNPPAITQVQFETNDDLAEGLQIMDVELRPSREQRPVVFHVDWPQKTILLEGHPDEGGVDAALRALDYANMRFRAGVTPYAANPSRADAAGGAFVGNLAGSLLGFGLGALIGSVAGAAAAGGVGAFAGGAILGGMGSYAGGIIGAATGAEKGAPAGQGGDAKLGAGLGAAVPYVGLFLAPLGAYLATKDTKKRKRR